MKRFSFFIPLIALMALAPLPALACGGGGAEAASGSPKPGDPSYGGFKTAQDFFAGFLQSGSIFLSAASTLDSRYVTGTPEAEAQRVRREHVKWVLAERKRKEAERKARERKAAANRSPDDLPGLDY